MIVRLVCMKVQPEKLAEFKRIYASACDRIRSFNGCMFLQLLGDAEGDSTVYTISHWRSQEDLDAYRHSEFFRDVWNRLKPLFRDKAWARSTLVLIDSSQLR